jgi:ABC-type Fe3+-hydroxamate transport system substrate-binding protein
MRFAFRLVLALVACVVVTVPALSQGFPVTVRDDRGIDIVIPGSPQRIVALGALYAQIVVDLGATDRLVGIADSPENPPEVAGIPSVGPTYAPSVEVIVSLDPDLVLGATDWNGDRAALEGAGLLVLTTPLLASVGDILDSVRTVGAALGEDEGALREAGAIAEAIVRIESEAFGADPLRAAFLYPSTPDDAPYAAGGGSIEGELLYRAGTRNIFADLAGFPQVSMEAILARDPEIIFVAETQVSILLAMTALESVSAVRNGLVVGIRASDAASTRVAEVLRAMVDAIHGT